MEWLTSNPIIEGNYIVETKTAMGNKNVLLSHWNGKTWSFNNQFFVKYLKEN